MPKLNFMKQILRETGEDLKRTEKNKNSKKQDAEQKEIIRRLRIQNNKLQEQLAELKKKIKKSKTDKIKIDETKQLNDVLAEALGSCPECWGQDTQCSVCHGNGISGWRKVNKRLFNVYVLPALENLYGLTRKIK